MAVREVEVEVKLTLDLGDNDSEAYESEGYWPGDPQACEAIRRHLEGGTIFWYEDQFSGGSPCAVIDQAEVGVITMRIVS